jgi:HSP20 family protein
MTLIKVNRQAKADHRSRFLPMFDEAFNDFFGGSLMNHSFHSKGAAVNIKEDEKNYHLEFAVPGFSKEEFRIKLENQMLTVSGEKKSESNEDVKDYTRREFSFASFERSFNLPESVNSEDISAEYVNGILNVHIPKKAEEKAESRSIEIK